MSGVVHVLAVMADDARFIEELGESADDLRAARAAVAELIVEAQRVADGTTGDLHYLSAALARVGGAA